MTALPKGIEALPGPPRRFNVEEYHRLGDVGLLGSGVELIDGVVYDAYDDRPHRFTVDDFWQTVDAGVIKPEERVELWDGIIVTLSPIGPEHQACLDWFNEFFVRQLAGRALVRVQGSMYMGDLRQPQPDLMLLRPRADYYREGIPASPDILLALEVGATSAEYDKRKKLPRYAQDSLQEVWLINLPHRTMDICRDPRGTRYRDTVTVSDEQTVAPLAFPDLTLKLKDSLGGS